jgi:hypothetical protein
MNNRTHRALLRATPRDTTKKAHNTKEKQCATEKKKENSAQSPRK